MNMTTSYMRRVEYEQQVEAGSILLRGLMAEGARGSAVRWAEQVYGPRDPRTERIKAAVTAPLTTDLDPVNALLGPFLERVRKPALIPRLPSVRYAPFNVRVPITTTPTLAAWTAEGGAVPVTTIGFTLGVLVTKKISSILPWPREFARLSTSQGNTLGERDLGTTIVTMEDTSLLSDAAETAAQPAGLLAGLSPVGDGGSPSTLADDVEVLFGECRGADPAAPVFITSPRGGLFLAMATDASGGKLFPNARGTDGGDLGGIPLLISKAAGSNLICLDAAELLVADGGLELTTSEQAAVLQDDAPGTPATLVSGWQTDTSFVRVTRILNWQLGHADAVSFMTLPVGSPA